MKKYIIISITIVVLIGFIVGIGFGTFKFLDSKMSTSSMNEYEENFDDATIKFTGKSKHFRFKVGRVILKDGEKSLLISNFEQTKPIDYLKKEIVTIKFADEEWASKENTRSLNTLKNNISQLKFYSGKSEGISNKIVPNFELPDSKSDFKKKLEIGIEYCTTDGNCEYEKFKISYSII